jgi:hypothetical protein
MNTQVVKKHRILFFFLLLCFSLFLLTESSWRNASAQEPFPAEVDPQPTPEQATYREEINPYFTIEHRTLEDGTQVEGYIIHGPPTPPAGYELERSAFFEPSTSAAILPNFPSFSWVFGCSAVSGAMIATYYDRNGYSNMYSGPTNGGVMPLTDTSWSTWMDGNSDTYPNNPLVASHQGVDGLGTRGSIDDYWVQYNSIANDPYITNGWVQHPWVSAIGDYMKTSQSAYGNVDGSTTFYNWTSKPTPLTCSDMVIGEIEDLDGTYGRKLFYEARGYTVTDCYNQKTDNNGGGFTLTNFQTEINAGHPVMLNLDGHTIVGYGYDGSTIYIRDTWDNIITHTHTMTWGGSYPPPPAEPMELLSVSIVHLVPAQPPKYLYLPLLLKNESPNQSPTDIHLSNSTISESQPINTVVGTLSTVDPNAGDVFTYTLASGAGDTGNAYFNISGNQLRSSIVFDYETTNSYSVRVRSTDKGGLFVEKAFTITITDVSESSLQNGDFEQGQVAWTEYSSNGFDLIVQEDDAPADAHGGEWLTWFGNWLYETSRISQTFPVPAAASYLHYWYWIGSDQSCGLDFFRVKVNGATLLTQDLCFTENTYGWVEDSIDLTAYGNTSITLMFEVTTTDSFDSGMLLDDVYLSGSAAVSPPEILPGNPTLLWERTER